MPRYCLTLNLRDDPALRAEYRERHKAVWPEIQQSLRDAGVLEMEIYERDGKLLMVMETGEGFSFERKQAMDLANPKVREWETSMSRYQEADASGLSNPADPAAKWQRMDRIFQLAK